MLSTLLRFKAGDIITEYDGRKVERVSDLPRTVAGTPVGRDVRFAWPLPDRHRLAVSGPDSGPAGATTTPAGLCLRMCPPSGRIDAVSADKQRWNYDAAVIGGGPGGSSVATALARAGRRVLVLERDVFPRFPSASRSSPGATRSSA